MIRKQFATSDSSLLKWHAFFFTLFTVFLWTGVLTSFLHPGSTPVEALKPFLVERMSVNIVWGLALLAHFGVSMVQEMLAQRALRLESPNLLDINYGELLRINGDDGVVLIDEEGKPFKRRRSS